MKDYMQFNACRKKSTWSKVFFYIICNMSKKEKAVLFSLKLLGALLLLTKKLKKTNEIYYFFNHELFIVNKPFYFDFLIEFSDSLFFSGLMVILIAMLFCVFSFNVKIQKVTKDFNPILRKSFYKVRFIRFLFFVKHCHESNLINRRRIKSSLEFCDQEMLINNYSNYSAHPFFIVSMTFLSAILAVVFNAHLDELIKNFILCASSIFAIYLLVGEDVSLIKQCRSTRQYCQWLTYFDYDEIERLVQAMKKV